MLSHPITNRQATCRSQIVSLFHRDLVGMRDATSMPSSTASTTIKRLGQPLSTPTLPPQQQSQTMSSTYFTEQKASDYAPSDAILRTFLLNYPHLDSTYVLVLLADCSRVRVLSRARGSQDPAG